jgi:DeoR/GlpR family transcriptional regulator of sugar metabolism
VAVLGAAGVSAANGVTELDDAAAEIQRLMIEQSARLIIVADGSKIGATSMAAVAPASAIHTLVTDSGAPEKELRALESQGIEVVVVDPNAHQLGPDDASAA